MELIFVKTTETSPEFDKIHEQHLKVNIYTLGKYEVQEKIFTYESGNSYTYIEVHTAAKEDYLPRIYAREDLFTDSGIRSFEIQTTSYGALAIEDIQKLVIALNEAIEAAQILTDKFVQ